MRSAICSMVALILPLLGEERYRISTVAGEWSTLYGYSGDGGPATQARLREPNGLAWGPKGELYILDGGNGVVRAINAAGIIRTVAGNGLGKSSDESARALDVRLSSPSGIAFDSRGNLYVTESQGHRIRRVSPDGLISTYAGTGARTGDLGEGGPATGAVVSWPHGIAIDRDDVVYFTDIREGNIRKVTPDGIIHTVIAGRALVRPWGLTIDREGNLYVADRDGGQIVKVDRSGQAVHYAGRRDPMGSDRERGEGGPARDAYLSGLWTVALDAEGRLVIASNSIWRVEQGGLITRVIGVNGTPGIRGGGEGDSLDPHRIQLRYPGAVLPDAEGNLYITDTGRHRVLRLSKNGELSVVAGASAGPLEMEAGPARAARFGMVPSVAVGPGGSLFVVDQENNRVMRISPEGTLHRFAGKGSRPVRNHGHWDPQQFGGDGGPAVEADLDDPSGIAFDKQGNAYIADGLNNRIRRVSVKDGRIQTIAGTGEGGFAGGFSGDGGPATAAQLSGPASLTVDHQGNLYFVDSGNRRIRKIDPRGIIQSVPGLEPATFDNVAVNLKGILFVTDRTHHRILRRSRDGKFHVVAGTGEEKFSGDGGAAIKASLNHPLAIAFDAVGNLYVSELWRIRKISKDGVIRTVVGGGRSRHLVEGALTPEQTITAHSLAISRDGRIYLGEGTRVRVLTRE